MKQLIAILAPGPSLKNLWDDDIKDRYDEVIAVNTASMHFESTWTVLMDEPMVQIHVSGGAVRPKIGYVSARAHSQALNNHNKFFREIPGISVGCHWSFPNAIFFAKNLKRCDDFEIHIFGFDCAVDKPDCHGAPGNHSASRFLRELTWVRAAWSPCITIFSDLPNTVEDWLNGKTQTLKI